MVTEQQRKRIGTILKMVISILLIYFIFTKINFGDVVKVLRQAHIGYLLLALLLFALSKVLNAYRLNLFFHSIGVGLTQLSNLKLYLLGMFYNLFLPGGIGGDAYKGYVIQKQYKVQTKKVVSVLILDRLNGMLLIFVFACLLFIAIPHSFLSQFKVLAWIAIPTSVIVFWWISKRFFSYTLPVFWGALGYSAVLQATQLLAVLCILQALAIQIRELEYLFVFLISSIVSVIPLTIGGIGSREVTFLYGSKWLGLDADTAIAVSFVFFLISALVSLLGIGYHIKKPQLIASD